MVTDSEFALWGRMKPAVRRLWIRYYPESSPLEFAQFLRSIASPADTVLEVGAGPGGFFPHGLRGRVSSLVGVDPDERVRSNPELDKGTVGTCEQLPFPSDTFDLVFHRMLSEHLADPVTATREIARVLKPGGRLVFLGPNRWHYSMVAARLTPSWFHRTYLRMLQTRTSASDVHPTYYRLNSEADIARTMTGAGLTIERLEFRAGPPGYLRFAAIAFGIGILFERTFERWIPQLRSTLLVVARRPPDPTH